MEKVYELYDNDGRMQRLCTQADLYDTLMNPKCSGWTYKELTLAEAIVKYGNMAFAAQRRHETAYY